MRSTEDSGGGRGVRGNRRGRGDVVARVVEDQVLLHSFRTSGSLMGPFASFWVKDLVVIEKEPAGSRRYH